MIDRRDSTTPSVDVPSIVVPVAPRVRALGTVVLAPDDDEPSLVAWDPELAAEAERVAKAAARRSTLFSEAEARRKSRAKRTS